MENYFPYEFHTLSTKELEEVGDLYGTYNEFIRVGPKKYFAPKEYMKYAASIYNMPLRPTDIFVNTFMRSGTTVMQELAWLLLNDFDYETAKTIQLNQRCKFLEFSSYMDDKCKKTILNLIGDTKVAEACMKEIDILCADFEKPDPRVFKTHLPLSLLPPKVLDTAKVVYVARDPRDVAVSAYHHSKMYRHIGLQKEFKQFWNLFRNGLYWVSPYFEHVKEAWAQRNHPNMLFIFYEDLIKDLPASVRRIAKFLGKEPMEAQITGLCKHLNIDNFKNNKSVNLDDMRKIGLLSQNEHFIRKVGGRYRNLAQGAGSVKTGTALANPVDGAITSTTK